MLPNQLFRILGSAFTCLFLLSTYAIAQCDAEGGNITFDNGSTTYTIIVDGTPDPLDVVPDGTQSGTNAGWVITDADLNILGLPMAPPFDLDGAGTGVCLIWHIRFEDGLMGAMVGMNAANLSGCFDLSNPLTVDRISPTTVNGGNIEFADGTTTTSICVDGTPDPLDVVLDGTSFGESSAWVITDDLGNILGLPAAPPFDLDPAGPGTCLIWYLSWNGMISGAAVGNNAADLSGDFDLSNPLTVVRNQVEGGNITFDNGSTSTTIIVDGIPDPLDVLLDGSAVGSNSAWVITDENGNILGLPSAPPFDFDGAGVGTCLIWYLRFEDGLTGAAIGNNASDLSGCFDLSNPLTVMRIPSGNGALSTGNISMPSGATTRFTCPGNDGLIPVQLNYPITTGQVSYVITDDNFTIIGIQDNNTIDASGAPAGTCYIFAFNYTGMITGAIGDNVFSTQFSSEGWLISNNGIQVVRQAPEGGTIATKTGESEVYVCIDGASDFIGFEPSGQGDANFIYVITDENNIILGLNTRGFENFEGAGSGICRVWGLSYTGSIIASPGDDAGIVDLTDRCWDLSENFITVIREEVDGGRVLSNGSERAVATATNPIVSFAGTSTSAADYAYFILDINQRIVAITFDEVVDFNLFGISGTYYIYGMSHNGNVLLNVGDEFWGRMVTDGCFERSENALVVTYDANARPFSFQPIAVGDRTIRIDFTRIEQSPESPVYLQVTDLYGRVLYTQSGLTTESINGILLSLDEGVPGLHFTSIVQGETIITEKVMLE